MNPVEDRGPQTGRATVDEQTTPGLVANQPGSGKGGYRSDAGCGAVKTSGNVYESSHSYLSSVISARAFPVCSIPAGSKSISLT